MAEARAIAVDLAALTREDRSFRRMLAWGDPVSVIDQDAQRVKIATDSPGSNIASGQAVSGTFAQWRDPVSGGRGHDRSPLSFRAAARLAPPVPT